MTKFSKFLIAITSLICLSGCEPELSKSVQEFDGTWALAGVGCEKLAIKPEARATILGANAKIGTGDREESFAISSERGFMQSDKIVFTLQGNMLRVYYRYVKGNLYAFEAKRYGTTLKISKHSNPVIFNKFSLVKCSDQVSIVPLGLRGTNYAVDRR